MFKSIKSVVLGGTLFVAVLTLPISVLAAAKLEQAQPNPSGIWASNDGASTVEIAPCVAEGIYCATVIEERLEPGVKSSLGQVVVQDLKLVPKKGWRAKFIGDGASFAASAKFRSENEVAFKICAMGVFCETQVFLKKAAPALRTGQPALLPRP